MCEVLSLSIYRFSNNSSILYITLKDYESKELFSGKAVLEEIPSCVLEQLLIVERGNVIGKTTVKQKRGDKLEEHDVNRYNLLSLKKFEIPIVCDSTEQKL